MHAKTRYNIRLAYKKGIVVKKEKSPEVFWKLFVETTKRNHFTIHPRAYCDALVAHPQVEQHTAWLGEQPLATAIIWKHKQRWVYMLGASSNEHKEAVAPYALHDTIIRSAMIEQAHAYDWWGIAAPQKKDHPQYTEFHGYGWSESDPLHGVTRFKAGFGGTVESYPDAFELVHSRFWATLFRCYNRVKGTPTVGHPRSRKQ